MSRRGKGEVVKIVSMIGRMENDTTHWSDIYEQSHLLQKKPFFFPLVNFKNNSNRC